MVTLERFEPGTIHRVAAVERRIGGGGVNAARVVGSLEAGAKLVSIVPAVDQAQIVGSLASEGISLSVVSCQGNVRVATILREQDGRMSVLNEPGAGIDVRDWEAFSSLVLDNLGPGRVLLCSGSLPPGAPGDGYARLARDARHLGSSCIVDAGGSTLAATLDAREALVVPNLAEAESVLQGPSGESVQAEDAPEQAREAANALLVRGAHAAVVTAGGSGAAYAERGPRGRSGWVPAPSVALASPIGAGDAFAAGLALRIQARAPLEEAVRFAVAVAAAQVESVDGGVRSGRVSELLGAASQAVSV